MADEEEIRSEVEAVQAVYGDDCRVINDFPPHLAVHIVPRTADDSSQQFVEVTLGLKSDEKSPKSIAGTSCTLILWIHPPLVYPKRPPYVYIVEMKGLDDTRQAQLISAISNKAQELSSYLMLVALCEEAVDILSDMNHPEGDCPLCLYPLVTVDKSGAALPFMKLMSCYHCFHSECIIRLWKWLQEQNKTRMSQTAEATSVTVGNKRGMHGGVNQDKAKCPVCRKMFDAKDMEHVLDYLGTVSSQLSSAGMDMDEVEKVFLHSDFEISRRQKFEALLKLQQKNSGLIEPKKNLAILPGMFLPENVANPSTSSETNNEQCAGSASSAKLEVNSEHFVDKATTGKHRNQESRRNSRFHSSKRPLHAPPSRKQWIRKEP